MTISPNASPDERDQYVFVYGTLKQGEHNHVWLPPNTRVDVGACSTVNKFPLVVPAKGGVPFLLFRKEQGENVEGQLYLVSQEELEVVDLLEGHPTGYRRTQIPVNCNGEVYLAWTYFLHPRYVTADLLRLPHLKSFSSKGHNANRTIG